ncbi:MAG: hypothetical protein F6K39_18215 [Okeania sp. SIO3B3]|nr:hypothetical protein [Okeania sp. SIO3B3]
MAGYIIPVGMETLTQSIKELNESVKNTNLKLPELLKVSIPSIETQPPNIYEEVSSKFMFDLGQAQVKSTGQVQYYFADEAGILLPMELQPQLAPTADWFEFAPESEDTSVFRLKSSYSAADVEQVTQAALDEYNSQNGTALVLPTKEIFVLPLLNKRSSVITLSAHITHDRTDSDGTTPGEQTSVVANWKPGTNIVEVDYGDGYVPPIADGSLSWAVTFYMTRTIPSDSITIFSDGE